MSPAVIRVTIDGLPVQVPEKTTVFEAVRGLGNTLPHYCYHPGIGIEGSCRVCQVEVAGPGKMPRRLAISCRTECAEGMEVWTNEPASAEARRMVLEFLLKNHPLDCPICDKAGECTLQNFAFDTGQGRSRSHEARRALRKRVDLGEVILFDEERCILCTRCVRLQDTVLQDPQLGVVNRGPDSVVGTLPGAPGNATATGDTPLHGNYQGNLADVCPVGALTLKKFRFRARAWQLRATPSVCGACSRGCNIHVETFRGAIQRIRPRHHADVNQHWMCDIGRFGYDDANDTTGRLSVPLLRRDGRLAETSHESGLAEAGKLLKAAAGPELLALASPFLTNEEGAAFLDLCKTLGTTARFVAPETGGPDELLHTGDPCANRRGLTEAGLAPVAPEEAARLAASAKACLLAGEKTIDALRTAPASAAPADRTAFLDDAKRPAIVLERRAVDRAAVAVCLPALGAFEKSGTWTNVQGLAQTVRRALQPPPGALADHETLARLRAAVLASGHGEKGGHAKKGHAGAGAEKS